MRGLHDGGHTCEVGDLYRMNFRCLLDAAEYRREIGGEPEAPLPEDVVAEHEKIGKADALAFIYPLWWSDCPAMLKGWFDRIWSYGYAYFYDDAAERHTRINIEKAVVICPAGHTEEHLEECGVAESLRRVMLQDRLLGVGVKQAELAVLGGMMPGDDAYRERNLARAYALGKKL